MTKSKSLNFAKKTAIGFLATGAMLFGSAAMADSLCHGVKLEIANNYTKNGVPMKIKVDTLNYKDWSDKVWRDQTLAVTEIDPGQTGQISVDLPKVENEKIPYMQVRLKWKDSGPRANWSDFVWSNLTKDPHGDTPCATNGHYTIDVTTHAPKRS